MLFKVVHLVKIWNVVTLCLFVSGHGIIYINGIVHTGLLQKTHNYLHTNNYYTFDLLVSNCENLFLSFRKRIINYNNSLVHGIAKSTIPLFNTT